MTDLTTYPWVETGSISYDDGDHLSELQIGPASSRRFTLDVGDGTYAVITASAYAIREYREVDDEGRDTGHRDSEPSYDKYEVFLDVEQQTEYIVCTDPDDPGSTELWSEYLYETPLYLAPRDEADAIQSSVNLTERECVEFYHYWNGKPTP